MSKAHSGENAEDNHAEKFAITRYGAGLMGATIYVTMEPCDIRRSGKKSCCEHIIESGIKRVVFGVLDPDTYVVCNGVEKLNRTGVETFHLKELERICRELTPSLPFDLL